MKLTIIKIGNSQGIRIPKAILDQCQFNDVIDVEVKEGKLILSAYSKPRKGWKEAFKAMAKAGDDALLDPELVALPSDEKDWKW